MKLVSYLFEDTPAFGRIEGNDMVVPLGRDLCAALASGISDQGSGEPLSLRDITLLPAVPNPGKIFCVGHNYEEHRQETQGPVVGHPSIFIRFADTLLAHDAPVLVPRESSMVDYEGELAVVIGKGGRRIAESEAMDHVAGYACANDITVRDWQRHTQQFTPGKNFPGTAPIGPFLVTPDEIDNLGAVTLTTRVNGVVMQHANVGQMIFPIPTIIAYLSTFTVLSAGDIILTGTPGGVGARRKPPVWLVPEDVVEVEISQIGVLRNRIAAEA